MSSEIAAWVDLTHAALMAVWVLGLPLLFWHRWPRLTETYAAYAIIFIVVNQLSFALLGECFLTTIARALWTRGAAVGGAEPSREWFTVRLAEKVFRITPSHSVVKRGSEVLILITAVGVTFRLAVRRRMTPSTDSERRGR